MQRLLIFTLSAMFCSLLQAFDVEVDGIFYTNIGSRKVCVTQPREWWNPDVKEIKAYAGDVVIPSEISYNGRTYTVFSLNENAFAGCDELTSVQLPPTLKTVNACAFLGCTGLRRVSVPASIEVFASSAFTGCTSLQQITLPRHAAVVDTLTFYCCASLTSVALPHAVRTVCQGAMEHLPSMSDLYCFSSVPPVAEQGAFSSPDQQQCTLHVPAEALRLYSESPGWKDFHRIVPLNDEDYIGQGYQRGDINDDGRINSADLALLQRLIVGMPCDDHVRWAADVNADGIVNAIDYVILAGL